MDSRFEEFSMITTLRVVMFCLALLLAAADSRAEGFDLITAAEAQQEAMAEAAAPPPIRTRQAPVLRGDAAKSLATSIQVISPTAPTAAVTAPLRIELTFKPAPGTRIVPSSFRVLYGLLKIDLTERLRKHATVSENGVLVEQAQVPDGQHRLLLQVADDKGNTAEQELRLRVGAAS